MSEKGSKLLFLAVGAALGAAVGYIAASDKKDEWLRDINSLVRKVKGNVKNLPQGCPENTGPVGEINKIKDAE